MNFQHPIAWLIFKLLGPDPAAVLPTTDSHPWLFTPAPPPTQSTPLSNMPPSPTPSFLSTPAMSSLVTLPATYYNGFPNDMADNSIPKAFVVFLAIILLFFAGLLVYIFMGFGSTVSAQKSQLDENEPPLSCSSGTIADAEVLGFSNITSVETEPIDPPAPNEDKLSMSEIISVETTPVDPAPQSCPAPALSTTTEFGFSAISSVETEPVDPAFVSTLDDDDESSTCSQHEVNEVGDELDRQVRAAQTVIQDKVQSFLERYLKIRKHYVDVFVPNLTEEGIKQADSLTAGSKMRRAKNKTSVKDLGAKQHKLLLALAGQESRPCNAWCDKCTLGAIVPDDEVEDYRCEICAKKQVRVLEDAVNAKRHEENRVKNELRQKAAAEKKQQKQQQKQIQSQKEKGKGKKKA